MERAEEIIFTEECRRPSFSGSSRVGAVWSGKKWRISTSYFSGNAITGLTVIIIKSLGGAQITCDRRIRGGLLLNEQDSDRSGTLQRFNSLLTFSPCSTYGQADWRVFVPDKTAINARSECINIIGNCHKSTSIAFGYFGIPPFAAKLRLLIAPRTFFSPCFALT